MSRTHFWWSGLPAERYWCEITDRNKLGDDLLCPQTQKTGRSYWSYSLISQIRPGDVIFHYYTPDKAFLGASVAIGTAMPDEMSWIPHGTASRQQSQLPSKRPAWRLPLGRFVEAKDPLTLDEVQVDEVWVRQWIAEKHKLAEVVASPFQPYPGKLRGFQGYITKMPEAFVNRWYKLKTLVEQISAVSYIEELKSDLKDPESVLATIAEDVRQSYTQGFNVNPKARRAIEDCAVQRAKCYYETQGFVVELRGKPYDLYCEKGGDVLYVEVKGTTTAGHEIWLTPNEVAFALDHRSAMALFIVSDLIVSDGNQPTVSGGTESEIRPWLIQPEHLATITYSYVVPRPDLRAARSSNEQTNKNE